ncbi:MAG: hypothetical protein AB7D57_04345 [Desulfovibrionaceae bacterium]
MNRPQRKRPVILLLAPLLASALALLLAASCTLGVKKWPAPVKSQDRFQVAETSLVRQGACMNIQATLTGAVDNLGEVDVQLEAIGDGPDQGCADCPFLPRQVAVYERGDPRLTRTGAVVHIQLCGLDPALAYRVRLSAANIYGNLAPELSRLLYALP